MSGITTAYARQGISTKAPEAAREHRTERTANWHPIGTQIALAERSLGATDREDIDEDIRAPPNPTGSR